MTAMQGIRMKNPAHPGGFVKSEIIVELGLSVTDAAKVLGVTRAALSAVLNDARACPRKWRCGWKRRSACRWTR